MEQQLTEPGENGAPVTPASEVSVGLTSDPLALLSGWEEGSSRINALQRSGQANGASAIPLSSMRPLSPVNFQPWGLDFNSHRIITRHRPFKYLDTSGLERAVGQLSNRKPRSWLASMWFPCVRLASDSPVLSEGGAERWLVVTDIIGVYEPSFRHISKDESP
ncbi:unnamed protein product [Gadus morhua 'NCC']